MEMGVGLRSRATVLGVGWGKRVGERKTFFTWLV